ncbi:MAG: hypothetical protein N3C12_04910 [Candidatus Binatia bacterium]|nr:hypothetical protein [Candidatus Binatia bacterium]
MATRRVSSRAHGFLQSLLEGQRLHYHRPQEFGKFAVVPVSLANVAAVPPRGYQVLAELSRGVRIEETGSVPRLRITNSLAEPLLVVEGQLLVGGLQNRVATVTVLIGPGDTVEIPVACVEAGRWHPRMHQTERPEEWAQPHTGRRRRRETAPQPPWGESADPKQDWKTTDFLFARAKARSVMAINASVREWGTLNTDQGGIWEEVAAKLHRLRSHSPTSDVTSAYRKAERELDEYLRNLRSEPGQVGFVAAIANRIVGAELFDHPDTLASLYSRLLRGYALDALTADDEPAHPPAETNAKCESETAAPFTDQVARRFVQNALEAESIAAPAIGLGEQVRIQGTAVAGSALVALDRVIHLSLFEQQRSRVGRPWPRS